MPAAFAVTMPGAIPATFQVGDQGEARYSIPIAAPAATGGLRPNVALSYNHLAGDGLAGMRWTLAGFSAITRCARTYAQDNVTAAATYLPDDRLCLDGQRLVEHSGAYGASGTQYRTEIETFQKVTQELVQGNGPLQFRVDHGNGTHSYYGATGDSRVEAPGTGNSVRMWYISYTEDQFQNRITYTYTENGTTGEVRPFEVTWTSNAAQSLTARYKIHIAYETRPDGRGGHDSGGSPWARTQRIDRIDVIHNGTTTVSTYDLAYASPSPTGTGRSQLQTVTLSRGADSLPSTVFTLQNGTRGWAGVQGAGVSGANPLAGDINGDGRSDLFVQSGSWYVHFGNAAGTFDAMQWTGYGVGPNPGAARVIDFDGDGRSDLLYVAGATWLVLRWTGSIGTIIDTGIPASSVNNALIADYDGDGLQDWLYSQGNGVYARRNLGGAFAAPVGLLGLSSPNLYSVANEAVGDLNGDGRVDLIVRWDETVCPPEFWPFCFDATWWSVFASAAGGGYTTIFQWNGPVGEPAGKFRFADINGDGLDDLAFMDNAGGWSTRLSTGTGLAAGVFPGFPASTKLLVADYDNDGRADLLRAAGDYWYVHRSNGTTWESTAVESFYSPGAGTAGGFPADVSGDGFAELLVPGASINVHKHNSALPDVVTTFTDGLGHSIDVVYEPLSNTALYSVDANDTPPGPYVRKYRGSRHVVTQERHDNGLSGADGEREFTHGYQTAYVDVSGRGWSSFAGHWTLDNDLGTFATTYFNRTWPYTGTANYALLRRTSDSQVIRSVSPSLDKTTWDATTPDRHFVRTEATTTIEHEVGGIANGQPLRTILDNPVYDTTYGHVTSRTTTITAAGTGETWTATTNFNPTADTVNWCLGQPGLVETTNTLPNFTTAVRRTRHVWDPNDCSLTNTTDESETIWARQLRTSYTYDLYGNPNIVSQDSVDGSAQNRSTDFNFDGFGQYPSSVTIGTVNLTTQFGWDYLTGQRASVISPDNLTTSWFYDPFGRLAQELRPVGSTTFSYASCGTCWPQNAVFSARAQDTDGSDNHQFFDELGRTVGESWKAPLGNEGRQETRYNTTGRVSQVSQPYVSFEPTYWTSYFYDLVGRLTSEDAPVSEAQPTGATTVYDHRGHELWITDAENNVTKYTHNAARQIQQVIDAMNGTTAYTYKHFGELATLVDAEFNTTTIGYDARGFKTSLADPNMGSWVYDTNVYGELTNQRSPLTVSPAWTTTLTYDEGGRIKTRVETEGTTTWNYYAAGNGAKGKVDTMVGPGNTQKYTYHATHGLPTQIRHTVGGTNYFYDMTYDTQARLDLLTYPTSTSSYRFKVDYDYDPLSGHNIVAKDGNTPSLVYYRLEGADAVGRETTVTLGNGLHEYRDYDRAAGHLNSIQTDPGLGSAIQNLSFAYDEVGNVLNRTNANIGKTETFTYDDLNRLYTMQVGGLSGVTMGYSAAGRITSRTDLGSYTYTGGCGGGPMAVKSAAGKAYCYDSAGRMTSRGGSAITWFSYDLPRRINNGTASTEFTYGVDRARITQTRRTGSTTNSTIRYIGGLLEREVAGSTTTWRHYVSARGRVVAQVNRVGTVNTAQYLHRDHQSSVVEVTGSTGALVQSLAFDAWGLRRNAATWAPLASPFAGTQPTKRGYTGHEHLDTVELIHMNGRVQDPRIGAFISADPFVQAPYHSQSHNRYAYVWNNPASLVDPSGFNTDDRNPFIWSYDNWGWDLSHGLNPYPPGGFWILVDSAGNPLPSADSGNAALPTSMSFVPGVDPLICDESGCERAIELERLKSEQFNRTLHTIFVPDFRCILTGEGCSALGRAWEIVTLFPLLRPTRVAERADDVVGGVDNVGDAARGGLAEARAARDALAGELAPLKGRAPATVTGGYNTRTGGVAARACAGGKCAEDHVADALGGNKAEIQFSEAVRPRTGAEVPVCPVCEANYGRGAFPSGTTFKSDL